MSGFGTIRQRSKGSWEIRHQCGGKTRTETLRSPRKTDAEDRLKDLLKMVKDGVEPGESSRKLTVKRWLANWLKMTRPEVKVQTFANYENTVKTWIEPQLGTKSLARLRSEDVQEFYTHLITSRLKPASAAHVAVVLNICLNRAVELHHIAINPASSIKKRRPRVPKKTEKRVLDRSEIAQLMAIAAATDLYHIVKLALATGARRGELLALRWCDVDLKKSEIKIRASVVRLQGETSRGLPKNGEERTITVPPSVIAELRRLKLEQAEQLLRLKVRQTGETEVFRRGLDGEIRTPLSVTNAFARLVARAGLPQVTFHALRHTHASELLAAYVPVHVAAKRLGHSDGGKLLLKTYAHLTDAEMDRDAATKIEAFLAFSS